MNDLIEIFRWYNEDCTLGRMSCGDFHCFTLELPDKDNQTNISCISDGEYKYRKYDSPKHGLVLLLENVPDRTYIEVHAGNFTSQILGCILVGDSIKYINSDGVPDVGNSKNTLNKLLSACSDTGTIRISG